MTQQQALNPLEYLWEYRHILMSLDNLEERLSKIGSDGWEMVNWDYIDLKVMAIFKRRRLNPEYLAEIERQRNMTRLRPRR